MVLRDRICDRLQKHRFTGSRRSNDKSTLSFSDRRNEIENSGGDVLRIDLHLQLLVGIQRRQIIEENLFARLLGSLEVDRLDLDQCEVTFAFLRRADLS